MRTRSRVICTALAIASSVPAGIVTAQILPKQPIVAPTVYYGPPPTGFRVASTTPVSASFTWGATSGAVSYQVMRSVGTAGNWTYLTPTPLPASAAAFTDNNGIDYRTTYVYRLQVNYSGTNPSGYADLSVTLAQPVNPTNFKAKQNAEKSVELSWYGVANVAGYTIFGPSIPGGAVTLPMNADRFTVTGLTDGQSYTWKIASTYQPGNITTAATDFPGASTTVLPMSGSYRVTFIGFTATSTTQDDLLDGDGKGDEIMPMAFVKIFNQADGRAWTSGTLAKGYIHGDNGGKFRSRVRAGTGSNTGGIVNGNSFPAGYTSGSIAPPSATTFSLKVFENTLQRDREVLLIYPTLWETDDAPSRWFDGYLSRLPQRTMDALNAQTTTGTKLRQAIDQPGISEIRGDNDFKMDSYGLNATGDRPIGIESVSDGSLTNAGGLFDRVIVLTQRKIEEALRQPPRYQGLPAGVIGLSFTEGGVIRVTGTPDPTSWNFSGSYALYLRVERIGQ